MKNIFKFTVALFAIVLCTGCIPYQGERPFDYPPARWISQMPDLWFDVGDMSFYQDGTKEILLEVQLTTENQIIDVTVSFDYTDRIFVVRKIDGAKPCFFEGHCKFSPEKLVVTVEKDSDSLLNGQYDTITFIRNESYTTEASS